MKAIAERKKSRAARKPPAKVTKVEKPLEQKMISYSELFSHGLPMELFFKQVTRPYERIAAVYKSVKALCDNVPQASLKIYSKKEEEEVDDERLKMLLENPNSLQTQNDFIQEWVGFYALNGEGFIKKLTGVAQMTGIANIPAQIINLDPSKVKERVDVTQNRLFGWRIGTLDLTLEEIIHTKDFNPYNPFRGLSPLKAIEDEIELDEATNTFNNAFFKNNATMGLILSTAENLTKEQRQQLKEAIQARHTGDFNAFKTLILEKGLEPKDAGHHSHKEMEFTEQKKWSRQEILGNYRVPNALFNITEDLNYATFMGQMRIFWLYALMPIMRKFQDSFNKHVVWPYRNDIYVAFDYKNTPAFQQDFAERVVTAQILFQIGFTPNEINEMLELGFEARKWRDYWWSAFSLNPIDDKTDLNKPDPLAEPAPASNDPADEDDDSKKKEDGKGIKMDVAFETKKAQFLKVFLRSQGQLEDRMERKMSRYYIELRSKILKIPATDLASIGTAIDWNAQNEALKKLMKPLIWEGINSGVAIGEGVLGRKKSVDDELDHRLTSYLQLRMDNLTGINDTIRTKLENSLRDALAASISSGEAINDQTQAMQEAVRSIFNLSASRSRLIARTESAGAVNGGSMLYYEDEGVELKQWVTSHDELVRDSHKACEKQGAIGMDRSFVNGLQYPADQANGDAAEVCNCRCSLLPIVR